MDKGTFEGLLTLALIIIFAGIWIWAWSGKRKKDFSEAANLPFADEPDLGGKSAKTKGKRHE
jgi:cytochrome c oxidase cbb3-type subunit 4